MTSGSEKGLLITLEGGEGAGKTTQAAILKEKLTKLGYEVVALREPGGTRISEQIREVVLSPDNTEMAFTTEVMLFQAARAQIYEELVLPALEQGRVVLMDRSRDSSVAYQGIVRSFGKDKVESLNNISTQNTYPDITFLLDIPVKIGLKRRADEGGENRMELENGKFHQKVRKAYQELVADDQQERWRVIDATQSVKDVTDKLWQIIEPLLPKKSEATSTEK